jgi:hypothetical protein
MDIPPDPFGPVPTEGAETTSSDGFSTRVVMEQPVRTKIIDLKIDRGVSVPVYETKSVSELINAFDQFWGTTAGDNLTAELKASGYTSPGSKNKSTIRNDYLDLIAESQRTGFSISDILARTPISAAKELTGGPFRSETTSITEYDPTNVTDIANAAYRARVGRNATAKEKAALADILNREQRRNPTVTISAGTTSGGKMIGADGQRATRSTVSTTTTRGGIDPGEIALQAATEDEDYEEVFNKVTSFDLMRRILNRPV